MPGQAMLRLHSAVALFGLAALFGRWIDLAPVSIVLGRTVFASLAIGALLRWRRGGAGPPTAVLAINGAILALHWVTFFAAVREASVAVALIGYASFPLFVVLIERGRGPTGPRFAVATLVVAGLLLTAGSGTSTGGALEGLVLGVVSGFAFALLAVRNRTLVAHVEPLRIALWQNVVGAAMLIPFAVALPEARLPSPRDWVLLVLLGVACTALAHTLFIASMRRVSAHAASVVAALEPVYGIAFAAVLLGESPSPRALAGAALIVAAAIVASRDAIR